MTKNRKSKVKKLDPAAQALYDTRKTFEEFVQTKNAAGALDYYDQLDTNVVPINSYMLQCILNVCNSDKTSANVSIERVSVIFDHAKTVLTLTESMYSQMIKFYCLATSSAKARQCIADMKEQRVVPKLRTFTPLLHFCSSLGEIQHCFDLYEDMHSVWELTLLEENYVALFNVCLVNVDAVRFHWILTRFMDDILQPERATWEVLSSWFTAHEKNAIVKIEAVHQDTGVCTHTGIQLRSLEMSDTRHELLLKQISTLACTNEKRTKQWTQFTSWVEKHGPFDAVIDAANVGYFKQNYTGSCFQYKQIQQIIDAFGEKKVLVLLHSSRTRDTCVPEAERKMVQQWKDDNIMFCCLPGNNDDWYWLYAALWSKGRTLLVTNDFMRDHHFSMLNPRAFLRWKERHVAPFDIKWVDRKRVGVITEPPVYSKQCQKLDNSWHFPNSDTNEWLTIYK